MMRLDDADAAVRASTVVHAGGVPAIEMTPARPGALAVVRTLGAARGARAGGRLARTA